MSTRIKLVQGDNRPYIKMTLKDADGTPINLGGCTVQMYFRAEGSDTVLSTIQCPVFGAPIDGQVVFNFPGDTLNVEPGPYEGEVEVNFGGEKQTVYSPIKFSVRQQFN